MSKVDVATEVNCLRGLIDLYWDISYKEGKDRRTHDTEDGKAQRCRHAIEVALRRIQDAAE
ncbi:MAG: hypothetical protein [Caudoviricetes sp.]|nr:MAG: hypothetical protein [Caudoviricetes sp.]